jgi:hypothetical protein
MKGICFKRRVSCRFRRPTRKYGSHFEETCQRVTPSLRNQALMFCEMSQNPGGRCRRETLVEHNYCKYKVQIPYESKANGVSYVYLAQLPRLPGIRLPPCLERPQKNQWGRARPNSFDWKIENGIRKWDTRAWNTKGTQLWPRGARRLLLRGMGLIQLEGRVRICTKTICESNIQQNIALLTAAFGGEIGHERHKISGKDRAEIGDGMWDAKLKSNFRMQTLFYGLKIGF